MRPPANKLAPGTVTARVRVVVARMLQDGKEISGVTIKAAGAVGSTRDIGYAIDELIAEGVIPVDSLTAKARGHRVNRPYRPPPIPRAPHGDKNRMAMSEMVCQAKPHGRFTREKPHLEKQEQTIHQFMAAYRRGRIG